MWVNSMGQWMMDGLIDDGVVPKGAFPQGFVPDGAVPKRVLCRRVRSHKGSCPTVQCPRGCCAEGCVPIRVRARRCSPPVPVHKKRYFLGHLRGGNAARFSNLAFYT